jgi:aspartate/tyrosine/aromatic aminotransferase
MLMVGSLGVKKKKYSFHKRKQNIVDYKGSISRIEKMSLKELVRNVGVAKCCAMNCCQHFPCEKTLLR